MEIRENPFVRQHAYDVAVAAEHGIAAALLYREIGYWCASNAARGRNLAGGRAWMYRSLHEFAACYPELSLYAIRRALRRLVSAGLILEASCNRMTADRTKWYTTQTEPLPPDAESLRFTEKENAPLKASRRYADPADVLPVWAKADMEPGSASLEPAEENADPAHADAISTNDNSDSTHADSKSTNGNSISTHGDAISTNDNSDSTHADAKSTNADSISTNGDAKSTNAFVESDKPIPTRNPTRTPTLKEYSYTTSTTGNSPRAGTEAPKATGGGGGVPEPENKTDGERGEPHAPCGRGPPYRFEKCGLK